MECRASSSGPLSIRIPRPLVLLPNPGYSDGEMGCALFPRPEAMLDMRLVFKFIGSKLGLFVVLMTLLSMTVAAAQAQTLTTLLTFNGQTDGAYSSSGLVAGKGGNFYGTTQAGGIYNFNGGTVFRVNRAGHETVLHSFCARTNCADGSTPYGGVILDSSGNLYGATSGGGAHGFGAV